MIDLHRRNATESSFTRDFDPQALSGSCKLRSDILAPRFSSSRKSTNSRDRIADRLNRFRRKFKHRVKVTTSQSPKTLIAPCLHLRAT